MGGRGQGTASYPDANENKIRTIGEAWGNRLNSPNKDAVSDYTGAGYRAINKRLRSGADYGDTKNASIKETVANLDEAISKFNLPRGITVYRGADGRSMFGRSLNGMTPKEIEEKFKGAVVRDKGFASTAINRDWAWNKNVVYEMRIPKGRGKGAYVDPISSHKGEKEFLVHRDSYWKVTGAYAQDGRVVVRMDYVPPAKGEALAMKKYKMKSVVV